MDAIYSLENPELMLQEIRERIINGRTEPLYYANQGVGANSERESGVSA